MKISRRVVAGDGTAKKEEKVIVQLFRDCVLDDQITKTEQSSGFNNKCKAWLEVGNQDHFSERRRSSENNILKKSGNVL